MVDNYIPKHGDVVFLDFNPTKGHEQRGYRPAVVISNDDFNINTNMVIVCPISTNTKEFPTHYLLEDTKNVKGSVFCEHVRSIDYSERNLKFVEKLSDNDLENVLFIIEACFLFDFF